LSLSLSLSLSHSTLVQDKVKVRVKSQQQRVVALPAAAKLMDANQYDPVLHVATVHVKMLLQPLLLAEPAATTTITPARLTRNASLIPRPVPVWRPQAAAAATKPKLTLILSPRLQRRLQQRLREEQQELQQLSQSVS